MAIGSPFSNQSRSSSRYRCVNSKCLQISSHFPQVGAGIRVPPNSSRLGLAWGVDFDSIKKEVSRGNRFVDWRDNILLDIPFSNAESQYGAPYYFIHRADLIGALVKAANKHESITLRMDSKVVSYDFYSPALQTADGQWHHADLIICANGIKSAARNTINGTPIEPIDTGDVAYRILVPANPLLDDPQTAHLVTQPWAVHWMGPEGHAVGYPLRGGELYNIIITSRTAQTSAHPLATTSGNPKRTTLSLFAASQTGVILSESSAG